jgi:hypothetical protein
MIEGQRGQPPELSNSQKAATKRSNLLKRKEVLEYHQRLLQTSALMRLRTNQPESKISELAPKRISHELEQINRQLSKGK